ncbi:hypothetical protein BDV98DRAFT_583162 [Pterulicium gracile]|uniref:ShKT domain-containing protein n=1 Tax=Pterulicium gracile TaxID=1884261 RepID=A0A5C3QLR2_9AGAR|nr:hypothetical protein BDV98DRAFT_583162 [Pterula gracilis]
MQIRLPHYIAAVALCSPFVLAVPAPGSVCPATTHAPNLARSSNETTTSTCCSVTTWTNRPHLDRVRCQVTMQIRLCQLLAVATLFVTSVHALPTADSAPAPETGSASELSARQSGDPNQCWPKWQLCLAQCASPYCNQNCDAELARALYRADAQALGMILFPGTWTRTEGRIDGIKPEMNGAPEN